MIIWECLILGRDSTMNNKKTLFVSLNSNLYKNTKYRFKRFNINNTKIYNVDIDKLSDVYFDTFDLIIIDSSLLYSKINDKTLIEVFKENVKKAEIFLLDDESDSPVPENMHISCVFSEPVLTEQLWKMMDKVLNKS